jgi:hypothetical protein
MKLDYWDVENLAAAMMGMDENTDSDSIEDALEDRFDVSFTSYQKIVEALIPFTVSAKAAINGEQFRGFVKDGAFICKAAV